MKRFSNYSVYYSVSVRDGATDALQPATRKVIKSQDSSKVSTVNSVKIQHSTYYLFSDLHLFMIDSSGEVKGCQNQHLARAVVSPL